MRIVFMGTPNFAVVSLRAIAETHDVVAVYTRPDSASGRGRTLRPSPVKVAAIELGMAVRQPATLRDPSEHERLLSDRADIIVVAAYGLILPPDILASARLGAVNVHASLLPRWRGAAPIQRAILAGDEFAGVSIMRMEEGLDTGPFCLTASTEVADKTCDELTGELADLGARILIGALTHIDSGSCAWTKQQEALVTYAAKIEKTDVALSPDLTAAEAVRRVRASGQQAPARANIDGKGVTVVDASDVPHDIGQGEVGITPLGLELGSRCGTMLVKRIKPDGKPEMAAVDWARGARLVSGSRWKKA